MKNDIFRNDVCSGRIKSDRNTTKLAKAYKDYRHVKSFFSATQSVR